MKLCMLSKIIRVLWLSAVAAVLSVGTLRASDNEQYEHGDRQCSNALCHRNGRWRTAYRRRRPVHIRWKGYFHGKTVREGEREQQ